ncbi:hypothetical protein ACFQUU_01885 [Herbaspirillum sp. GCM10030257]|uniref:hypothetical protein n=1 Tax=Herbaspirillum sp. GCM10030257 TaxID=3273393 RepID=UPI003607977E
MKVELDLERLEDMLDMWRKSVDLQVPMMDDFKIRMMQNRRQILENLVQTATGWNLMLNCMHAPDDTALLHEMKSKVSSFVTWAAGEIDALDAIG